MALCSFNIELKLYEVNKVCVECSICGCEILKNCYCIGYNIDEEVNYTDDYICKECKELLDDRI